MTRGKRRPRDAAGVSLFPFLAVLLCTMGALIVLLVVIAHRAQAQVRETQLAAVTERSRQEDERRQQAQAARQAEIDRQTRTLESQAGASAAALARKQEAAARLAAAVEEAERRLAELLARRRELERRPGEQSSDEELRRQLAELDERWRQARANLSDRQRAAAAAPQELYSIIPYAGRNGSARRPIYVECLADRVVIQPEGTELMLADFEVLGPGNPLEAAVRATVAYWNQSGRTDVGNAYPLLLVRPAGVTAYQAAHAALRTWGREFGYEVVHEDWKLAYPPSDPELADQQREAIALAREHMQTVAKTQPQRRRSAMAFQIGVNGTLEPSYGFDDDEGVSRPSAKRGSVKTASRGPGRGTASGLAVGGLPPGAEAGGLLGQGSAGADGPFGSRLSGPDGAPGALAGAGRQSLPMRPGTGGPNRGNSSNPFAGIGSQLDRMRGDTPQPGGGGEGASRNGAAGTPGARSAGEHGTGGNGEGGHRGGPPNGQGRTGGAGAGPPGASAASGASGPGGPSIAPGGGAAGAGSPGGGQPSAGGMPDDSTASMDFTASPPVTPIAKKEGANWALPTRPGRGSSPLRRDVHMIVDETAITVFVDPRTAQTLPIIRLGPDPVEAAGELKDAIWKLMKDWGNPPAGFHWRPVLRTQVTYRGSARYNQLGTLLEDSGFEMGK